MSESIIYVDRSEVREGRFEELAAGMTDLVSFVAANEPRILAYNVYFSDDRSRMTVIHVHEDPASLEQHMRVAGPEFPKVADFIRLLAIDLYGDPGDAIVSRIRRKAEMLGSGVVRVHEPHEGLARFAAV